MSAELLQTLLGFILGGAGSWFAVKKLVRSDTAQATDSALESTAKEGLLKELKHWLCC